jgi:hypothetical protein
MVKSAFGEVEAGHGTTFRTVTRRETKIVYNKAAVDALYAGVADAVIELCTTVRDEAARGPGGSGVGSLRDPAAAAEHDVPMMLDTGRVAIYALGKLVSGTGERTAAGNKPRGAATPADQVVGFVMFDSPLSHFAELGTINEPARPFLLPAFEAHVQDAGKLVLPAIRKRVNAVPG